MRWLQDRPSFLEWAYTLTQSVLRKIDPLLVRLGYDRVDRLISAGEELTKRAVFDCRMCGQCILHSTGMTCPMTCPKELRNGPCGGVRSNGHCEVIPEMRCVWVAAVERSLAMPHFGDEIVNIQPPVNRRLKGSSAWVNLLSGVDKQTPSGWVAADEIAIATQDIEWRMLSLPGSN